MEVRVEFILTALIVNFGLTFTGSHDKMEKQAVTGEANGRSETLENLKNLFDSIAIKNIEKTEIYREKLREDVTRNQENFHALVEEVRIARGANAYKRVNFYTNGDTNENVTAVKREATLRKKIPEKELFSMLAGDLNLRMGMMKQVAGYKFQHNISVLDREREEDVMKQSRQAAELYKLDTSTITEFVETVMNIGKALQSRFVTDWLIKPEVGWHPIHIDSVRDHIVNVDKNIFFLVSIQLHKNGGFEGERREKRMERLLSSIYLLEAEKKQIFISITKIKIVPDREAS